MADTINNDNRGGGYGGIVAIVAALALLAIAYVLFLREGALFQRETEIDVDLDTGDTVEEVEDAVEGAGEAVERAAPDAN